MPETFTKPFTQQEPIPEAGIAAALAVLRHGRLHRYNTVGDEISETAALEEEFAAFAGARYCLAVASGGYALGCALRALGVGPGDRVLTNAFTLAPVPGAVAAVGAVPVFVDVDEGLTIYLDDLAAMAVAALPMAANAAPVNVDTWYTFGFGGVDSALTAPVAGVTVINPNATAGPVSPWTFTLASTATLFVLDLFLSVDQFELFNFGNSLGLTSAPDATGGGCTNNITCAIGNLDDSRGTFTLAACDYSITATPRPSRHGTVGSSARCARGSPTTARCSGTSSRSSGLAWSAGSRSARRPSVSRGRGSRAARRSRSSGSRSGPILP